MKQYVEVIRKGHSFSTHPDANKYGCVKYHHFQGLPSANNGDILEIVKDIMVNGSTPSYILRNEEGVEYIISKEGVKLLENYKPMSKVEAPKTFLVKGDSKHLLKACLDEILELGYIKCELYGDRIPERYFVSNISEVGEKTTLEDYKKIYINNNVQAVASNITFTLPQDYSKAIEHAKSALESDYWSQSKVKKMKFGELTVEVTPGLGYVQIAEGKIYKEELGKVITFLDKENRPKLLGYTLEIRVPDHEIKFGCKKGLVSEIKAIYEAM